MNPVFVVELLYRIAYSSQNSLASFCRKFGITLDQSKEGCLEVWKHQHAFLSVAIDVYSKKPIGAFEFRSKALGQIVELP